MKRKNSTIKESPKAKADTKKGETPKKTESPKKKAETPQKAETPKKAASPKPEKKEQAATAPPATKKAKKENSASKKIDEFEELNLVEPLNKLLSTNNITTPSEIQSQTLASAIAGEDLNVIVKPGTDTGLCFLIPALEILLKAKDDEACGVLICSSSAENLKVFKISEELLKENKVAIAWMNNKATAERIALLNSKKFFVVGHPKSLLYFANKHFIERDSVKLLIFDDVLANLKYDAIPVRQLLHILPKQRQTIVFSSAQTVETQQFAKAALRPSNQFINATGEALPALPDSSASSPSSVTVNGLELLHIVVPGDLLFAFLYSFLKKNMNKKKILVSFELKETLEYFAKICDAFGLIVQSDISETNEGLTAFLNEKFGILLSHMVQKKKGDADLSKVDWLIYFDIPTNAKEFATSDLKHHTSGAAPKGKAILMLLNVEDYLTNIEKALSVRPAKLDFAMDSLYNYSFNQELYDIIDKDHSFVDSANGVTSVHKRYISKILKDCAFSSPYKQVSNGVIHSFFGLTQGNKSANISEKEFREKVNEERKKLIEICEIEKDVEANNYCQTLSTYCRENALGNPFYKFSSNKKQCAVVLKKDGVAQYYNGKTLYAQTFASRHAAKVALEALTGQNPHGAKTDKSTSDSSNNHNNKSNNSAASPNNKKKRKRKSKD